METEEKRKPKSKQPVIMQSFEGILKANEGQISMFTDFIETNPICRGMKTALQGTPNEFLWGDVMLPCLAVGFRYGMERVLKDFDLVGHPENGLKEWKEQFDRLKKFVSDYYLSDIPEDKRKEAGL